MGCLLDGSTATTETETNPEGRPHMQNSSEQRQAEMSLARILPRLEERHSGAKRADWSAFRARLDANFPDLFGLLVHLYGGQYDFFYHLENMLDMAARMWLDRPAELKALDLA